MERIKEVCARCGKKKEIYNGYDKSKYGLCEDCINELRSIRMASLKLNNR